MLWTENIICFDHPPFCWLNERPLGAEFHTECPCVYFEIGHFIPTVYPKKYAHGFVVLCFVVVMQSFIMNSHEVFIHIHQGCFVGTGAIVRLPQCQWSKPDGYGKISQCITTTTHSIAKTVCIFLGIYCMPPTYWMRCLIPVELTNTADAILTRFPADTLIRCGEKRFTFQSSSPSIVFLLSIWTCHLG